MALDSMLVLLIPPSHSLHSTNPPQANGKTALLQQALRLGDIKTLDDPILLGRAELEKAWLSLTDGQREMLQRTRDRIEAFAKAQRSAIQDVSVSIPGGSAGHTIAPMAVAGCYAPGGRYPLPSSVLMTAVTAKAAGVTKVWVASPRPSAVTLGAAFIAQADAFLAVGGAQAVAALAYGVGEVDACDIIVGPGNKWVTAAKSLISGVCAIDMLAGPSEVLVLADATADPQTIAADLLAQAEHDVEARPILVATSRNVIDQVNDALVQQLAILPTGETARPAVLKGFAVEVSSVEEGIQVSDKIAPEHLEIQTADAKAVAFRCKNYGAVFIGHGAAEVLGDYGAGPNHVLPTGGTAKYTGGLSVFTFLRVRTWMSMDDLQAGQVVVKDAVELARLEGLEGHARAAEKRLLPA
jgi:phosphoribosyl-ATP pyrophosphohydrolase/phosphoribosyl-AMP cyclohydrolase/histidinol dehydrogenase